MPEALSRPPSGGDGATRDLSFATRVIRWQGRHGRHDLPWQRTRDAYRVWLSEVMLQQTQVATVLGYYGPFLERFPTVNLLAAASLDEVLSLWSGLGYYSRARNLHRCAQLVVAQHGGEFPRDSATLATLPGIGRSTAAAIAAFCFGERAAILDGNVKRVLARVTGFGGDLAERRNEQALWVTAQGLLPERGIERYTQGLMDLGAQVCTVREPGCDRCPVRKVCVAHAQGRPQAFPVKSRRVTRGRRESLLIWVEHRQRTWLVQRPPEGVWAALWCLPEQPDSPAPAALDHWPVKGHALPPTDHALTHFDWRLRTLRFTLPHQLAAREADRLVKPLGPGRWLSRDEALALGLPAPIRKLLMGG